MTREIDILLRAERTGFLVVEKDSHLRRSGEELEEAAGVGVYLQQDDLAEPPENPEISSPFPGCPQIGGSGSFGRYCLVGHTRHFLIFAPPPKTAREKGCLTAAG